MENKVDEHMHENKHEHKHGETLPHDHGTITGEILEEINSTTERGAFEEASDVFALLGDATRLKIFWLLCHSEDCVINIAAAVGMSAPAVSHHLKMLKQMKLIKSRKIGKEVHYKAVDTDEVKLLHEVVESLLKIKCPTE